jgi:hypothetical protein
MKESWLEVVLRADRSPESKSPMSKIDFLLQPGDGTGDFVSSAASNIKTISEGQIKRYSVPLDLASTKDDPNRFRSFSISAPTASSEIQTERDKSLDNAWPAGRQLHLLSMRVVNKESTPDDGEILDDSRSIKFDQNMRSLNLLANWWCDDVLKIDHKKEVRKSIVTIDGGIKYDLFVADGVASKAYLGGIEGVVYPSVFVDHCEHIIELVVSRPRIARVNEDPRVGVVVYSGETILGKREDRLGEHVTTIEIPLQTSGLFQSMAVGVSGADRVTIDALRIISKQPTPEPLKK